MVTAEEAVRQEAQALLDRWIAATLARDAQAYADLYVREPDPVVAWPNGEVTRGWRSVFEHARREFYSAKPFIRDVHLFDLQVVPLSDVVHLASFGYDVHASDLWGAPVTVRRMATATLVRTKDGLRLAGAHYAPAPHPAP